MEKQIVNIFIFLLFISISMAYTDTFDGTGDDVGSGWVEQEDSAPRVSRLNGSMRIYDTSSNVFSAVKNLSDSGANVTNFSISFNARESDNDIKYWEVLNSNGQQIAILYRNGNLATYYSGGWQYNIGSMTANVWHNITFDDFDFANDHYDLTIDGTTYPDRPFHVDADYDNAFAFRIRTAGSPSIYSVDTDNYTVEIYDEMQINQTDFEINNCTELQNIPDASTDDWTLGNDIDCSDTVNWNAGAGFDPITNFAGIFNGQNYTIDALFINRSTEDEVGLFGNVINGGSIHNLTFTNADITGNNSVGTVVGLFEDGYNLNITILSSSVTGEDYVGGLVGLFLPKGDSNYNRFEGQVTGDFYVGGVVGRIRASTGATASTVNYNYVDADIHGRTAVGGVLGGSADTSCVNDNCRTWVYYSEVHGTVTADETRVGGLIGLLDQNALNQQSRGYYSTIYANVTGDDEVGGVVGYCLGSTSYKTAFSRNAFFGNVIANTSNTYYGTMAGRKLSTTACSLGSSVWDTDKMVSGISQTSDLDDCTTCLGNTTIGLFNSNAYPNFDFTTIFNIWNGSSYAWLRDLEPLSIREPLILTSVITSPVHLTQSNESMVVIYNSESNSDLTYTCSLYIDDTLNMTNSSFINGSTSSFSPTHYEGFLDYYVHCSDSIRTVQSDTQSYYYDGTPPYINSLTPNIFNSTIFQNYEMRFEGNVTNLNLTNVTRIIYYPNSTIFEYNETTTFIDPTIISWDKTYNTTFLPQGTWTYYIFSIDSTLNTNEAYYSFIVANCIPNWVCSSLAPCNISDQSICDAVNDNNACGLAFGMLGESYLDFGIQSCDYCAYDLSLVTETNCDSITDQKTVAYIDNNFVTCCQQTNLPTDCYYGNESSGSENVSCSFFAYTENDITPATINSIVKFILSFFPFIVIIVLMIGLIILNKSFRGEE